MSKYIGAYGKQALVVNFQYSSKAMQEAKRCIAYFSLIENGLLLLMPKGNSGVSMWTIHDNHLVTLHFFNAETMGMTTLQQPSFHGRIVSKCTVDSHEI